MMTKAKPLRRQGWASVTSRALFPIKSKSKGWFGGFVCCFALDVFISYSIFLTSVSVCQLFAFLGLYTTAPTRPSIRASPHFLALLFLLSRAQSITEVQFLYLIG